MQSRSPPHARLALVLLALPLGAVSSTSRAADLRLTVLDAADKPVADAIVYAIPKQPTTRAPKPGMIDQIDRRFVPRVSAVQTGAAVEFPNSDDTRHSVYSFSPANPFTLKLYAGKPANPVIFPKPGIVVLGCNIHDNMVAWVLVVDTPFFARTNATGQATLTGLEPGDYQLKAWRSAMREEAAGEALQVGAAPLPPRVLHVPTDDEPAMGAMQH